MSKQHTYAEISTDFNLWIEYVDADATMTKTEFDALTTEEKVEIQVQAFGPENCPPKTKRKPSINPAHYEDAPF